MRIINDQLSDITAGIKTVDEILDEGVGDYAIQYFSSQTIEQARAYRALYIEWKKREDSKKKTEPEKPKEKIELVKCTCGHSIRKSLIMNANLGTSCPDCYDRMSD